MKYVNGELVEETQADLDQRVIDATPPPITKEDLHNYASAKRYEVEISGITVNGLAVPTDDRAKSLINGGAGTFQPTDVIKFKISPTNWIDIDGTTLIALKSAIAAHVQACFNTEAAVATKIENEDITTFAEIDAEAWPS